MAIKKTSTPKPSPSGSRKITVTGSSRTVKKPSDKTAKLGSMVGSVKLVSNNRAAKKSTARPTGELAKSNSNLAKFIYGHGMAKGFTMAEARIAAGKYRDAEKAAGPKGFGSLDRSGNALGLAIQQTRKMRKGK